MKGCHQTDHLLKTALEAVQADEKQTPGKKQVSYDARSVQRASLDSAHLCVRTCHNGTYSLQQSPPLR